MADQLLSISRLSKTFPGMRVLNDVSLSVAPGEIVAVLGQNGSGKSTLVKVLAGIYTPDDGAEIVMAGPDGQRISEAEAARSLHFIHQDLGLVPTLSAVENLDLGRKLGRRDLFPVNRRRERARASEFIARFGGSFDVSTPLKNLTPSERTMVAIARALSGWAHSKQVLVLDEPTAALHGREVDRLFQAVRMVADGGAGVLFISHRLDEVFALANRVVVLRDGIVTANRRIGEIDEERLVALIAGREVSAVSRQAVRTGDAMLRVRGVSGGAVKHLDLTVAAGEVVGIAGLLGSGREDVADLIFGVTARASGTVEIDGTRLRANDPRSAIRAGAGLVPAERLVHGALPEMSVRENLTLPRLRPFRGLLGRMLRRAELREASRWIAELDVRPADSEKAIALLSGGNQQKIMVARWLRNDPRVLLLDEPTQGVDVGVKATILELVRDVAANGRAVVVLSCDARELAQVCDRVVVLSDGVVFADLRGDAVTEAAVLGASLGLPGAEDPPVS
jgi:ribose transport system ATP-binding protein